MEGYLKKYKNFVSGYKKCYCRLEQHSTNLIILKGDANSEQKVALNLRNAKVEINPNQSKDFILSADLTLAGTSNNGNDAINTDSNTDPTTPSAKLTKLYFQAKDPREKN